MKIYADDAANVRYVDDIFMGFGFLGTASRYALAYELEFVMIVTEAASKVLFYKSAGFHVRSYPSQCEPRSSGTNSQAC